KSQQRRTLQNTDVRRAGCLLVVGCVAIANPQIRAKSQQRRTLQNTDVRRAGCLLVRRRVRRDRKSPN
ncbi:hypothetical protein, partial [Microcoleus sp. Aus8_D3]|uniref:hypothetical protein n=1 Tax=Microcoleus sp. Aus8_D3 TaxID=2818633 RepID=UPI002FD3FD2D